MSELGDWRARKVPLGVPRVGSGVRYIRCGLGWKDQLWSYGGAPRDSVPARDWEASGEAALTAEHVHIDPADIHGRMVGQAFSERVLNDPKVQATGAWLCFERPLFRQLFKDRLFPILQWNGPTGRLTDQHRKFLRGIINGQSFSMLMN
jgi:hypothetical protein